jgi:glycine oxidase
MDTGSGDIAIVGAGIIGLSVAFELAARGASVRIYDTAEPARAASWAAAGMLAPLTERLPNDDMQALCESSLGLYPEFAQAIQDTGGIDPHLRLDGILHAAYSGEGYARLRRRSDELHAGGHSATLLTRSETLLAEPALGKDVCGALLVPGEGQVDNRRLGRALVAACEARGVRIHIGVASLSIEFDARRVLGVQTDLGYVPAAAVVNAAGAGAANLRGVPAECVPPVRAVKGQMLSIQLPVGFMRRTTWVPGAYLVPRADGRLLVGATVEHATDVRVTASGIHALLHAAVSAAPALGEFAVSETWAGLRPGTPDELPCLGETPREGYYLATGHNRNGILLAPATARLLAQALLENSHDIAHGFTLRRFGTKAGIA